MKKQPHAICYCGAKTRSGLLCKSLPVTGKKRCRMHGGAHGSGAPIGNKNALKNGYYTREAIEKHRALKQELKEVLKPIKKTDDFLKLDLSTQ